jgi:Raf kinase inhibitor-like YbhB/YbcL family protein
MKTRLIAAGLATALSFTSAHAFEASSADITNGGTLKAEQISNIFGCKGGNISPSLSWKDAPEGTKSFAVSMYDPDAPTGSGFWHWVAFDIPASTNSLPAGASTIDGKKLPAGTIQVRSDASIVGYVGACPPPGPSHHYVITVKALKVEKLGLDANATPALVGFMTNANKLADATITATYGQ